jgi:transcriptional regulator with XRE-family HTH domain
MKEPRFIVGANVRSLRGKLGLTQLQCAYLAGIDYKYLQKIESKDPPNVQINTLAKIAKALKTTASDLLK